MVAPAGSRHSRWNVKGPLPADSPVATLAITSGGPALENVTVWVSPPAITTVPIGVVGPGRVRDAGNGRVAPSRLGNRACGAARHIRERAGHVGRHGKGGRDDRRGHCRGARRRELERPGEALLCDLAHLQGAGRLVGKPNRHGIQIGRNRDASVLCIRACRRGPARFADDRRGGVAVGRLGDRADGAGGNGDRLALACGEVEIGLSRGEGVGRARGPGRRRGR